MKHLKQYFLFLLLIVVVAACKEDNPTDSNSGFTISKFAPSSASIGDEVVITGNNFSAITTENVVKINDKVATVRTASITSLTIIVPTGATTGKISVTIAGKTTTSFGNLSIREISELPTELSGTLEQGEYQLKRNAVIPVGKSLTLKPGVKIVAFGNGTSANDSPEITVKGNLYSLGTEDNPVIFTVPADKRTDANLYKGFWGGLQGDSTCTEMIIKWTRLEYVGGPADGSNINYASGDPRYGVHFQNVNGVFVFEDSWIYSSSDDAMRVNGGKINISRNTFEHCCGTGGESVNIKSGTVGNISYNMIIGCATNGIKLSNSGGKLIQANCDVYNNTILNSGFRRAKTGRGGSLNLENGAKGRFYNNLIVNCKYGFRIVGGVDIADTANSKYGYNLHYGSYETIVNDFNPAGSLTIKQANDIMGVAKANNPGFVGYNVDQFTESDLRSVQPTMLNRIGNFNFRLSSNSPAKGKGYTGFNPVLNSIIQGTVNLPSSDLGAYPTSGMGNKHN